MLRGDWLRIKCIKCGDERETFLDGGTEQEKAELYKTYLCPMCYKVERGINPSHERYVRREEEQFPLAPVDQEDE
jgi:uncharacterized protein YlaI